MANQDHHTSLDDGNNPLVPIPGEQDPAALLLQQPYASPHVTRTPSVVTSGMDPLSFANSLRRRWMLATFMGLLVAAGTAFGIYLLLPETETAEARFQVVANPTVIMTKGMNVDGQVDFDIFRATQLAKIKSFYVLKGALTNPILSGNRLLNDEEYPTTWLADNLNVQFEGDSELMRVSLSESQGTNPALKEELRKIVEAVCQAYLDEVVNKERIDRAKVGDALKQSSAKIREEIRRKWDEYQQIADDLGLPEGGQFDPTVRVIFDSLKEKMKEEVKLQEQLRTYELDFQTWYQQQNNPDVKEQAIEAQVMADPSVQMMDQELLMMESQLRDARNRSRGRMNSEIVRMEEKYQRQMEMMESEKQQIRAAIKQKEATTPDIAMAMAMQDYRRRKGMLLGRLQQLKDGYEVEGPDGEIVREKGIDEMKEDLERKAQGSTDLLIRKAELEQLERTASDLGRRLEAWDIESQADDRIKLIETAHLVPGMDRFQRYFLTGLGGIGAFVVTCLGIGYLEFLGRRLNGPQQVDEGLGIRVVGTLPKLKAKHQAQITESIDSVRTALMHESTTKQRQVVLVTSPRTMEGRTTVASQLAGSLARAGRRTLLVDGDLRRPALHSLFNVPLEDGLCEVLRAEAEVADVVRATEAEGLWLLTAGYCDADAVHAMATDQIQPIFEKLRTEYDFVIIDGAPLLGLSDPLMMGQHCDGALLSVLRDHTTVPDIYQSSELLRSVGIRLIGSVVNGVGSKVDRRVNHLQMAAPKSNRKQLEAQPAEAAVATEPKNSTSDDDFNFSDLGDED